MAGTDQGRITTRTAHQEDTMQNPTDTPNTTHIHPCPCGCGVVITFFDADGEPVAAPPLCPCGTQMPSVDPEDYPTYFDMYVTDPYAVRDEHRAAHGEACYATGTR